MISFRSLLIRQNLIACLVVQTFLFWTDCANAQFPSQPLKILVPYAAGGLPDTVARIVGRKLQELIGQPVVIENRAGASGGIAVSSLTSAPADGYTLLVTEGSILYNSLLFTKLPYDPQNLLPVAQLARAPMFLVTTPKLPVSSMKEFIEYAKARPGKINYGSAGVGSPHHLSMEAVKSALQLDLVHVPYKGTGEAVPALLGGHIDILFAAYPTIAGFAKEKKVTLLGTNALQSSPQAPDVPPLANFIPGYDLASIVGIYARTGTPPEIVRAVSEAAIAATKDPDVIQRLFIAGVEAAGVGPTEFTSALASERNRISAAVSAAKITIQ